MTRAGLEIRVGFTVVLAAVILAVGTMWFQKFQLVEKRWSFFVTFDQVGRLVSGDPVVVNGVESGRVEDVALEKGRVLVEMSVRDGVVIPDDSYIALKSIGIMGERFVAITRGTSQHALAPGDSTSGEFLMGLSEVMGTAGSILDEIAQTTKDLRAILDTLNKEGRLRETMNNFADASARLRTIADENQPQLANTIDRFEHVSALMDSLVSNHYTSLDSSLGAVGRSGSKFETAVDNLEEVSSDLREITQALRDGDGTLGKLIQDDEMADKLQSTIAGLDSLITDMKLHPGRYVTFKLF
jgi:phospholipid/cholesterol/gamma-HCH transport system substrate-binding protein